VDTPKTFESNRRVPMSSEVQKIIKPLLKIVIVDLNKQVL